MDKRIGWPEQLKYKKAIEEKGLKKSFVAKEIDVSSSLMSTMINGRLYMPDSVKEKLDNFLKL